MEPSVPTQNRIAKSVRLLRERQCLTQEHLAEAARISVRTLQRVEGGEPLSKETARAIAGALNVDLDALFDEPAAKPDVAQRFEVVDLQVVERFSTLFDMMPCDAHQLSLVGIDTDEVHDARAVLEENLSDLNDLWAEVPATERRHLERHLQEAIDDVRRLGLAITAGVHRRKWKVTASGRHEVIDMRCLCVVISPEDQPRLKMLWDRTGQGAR